MSVRYKSDGNVDGTVLGQATTEKIGFYGGTPVVQPSATAQSAVATTALTTIGSTTLTATDLTSLNAIVTRCGALTTLVNQLRTDLVTNLNLLKGSA
jgi:hypothetical protein